MEITILGAGSAMPTLRNHPSAQLIQSGNDLILVDCGEATQYRLLELGLRNSQKLRHIFISHLHGDHYFGLMGLLTSLGLNSRTEPLHLYAPTALQEVLTAVFRASNASLTYPLLWHPLDQEALATPLLTTETLTVEAFAVKHRIPCFGFLFREKSPLRRLRKERISAYISYEQLKQLKQGHDIYDEEGRLRYAVADFTLPPEPPQSYAYCTDTLPLLELIPILNGIDLLYHEATFLEEHSERAAKTYHSTAKQAAMIAREANVGALLLGHLSSRYTHTDTFLKEATTLFTNTYLAEEGRTYSPANKRLSELRFP